MSVTPQQFGAIADGASHPLSAYYATLADAQAVYPFAVALTDEIDGCAIQKALLAVRLTTTGVLGGKVCLPTGQYRVNRTLTVQGVRGLRLEGDGESSQLFWWGDAASPVFLLDDCQLCRFAAFWVMHGTSFTGSPVVMSAFDLINGGGQAWAPTANVFEDVSVGGFNIGTFQYGWRILASGSGGDNNNDLHRWVRCRAESYTQSGWHIHANQAKGLALTDCQFSGNGVGKWGVHCETSASFDWRGGGGGANTQADFGLDDASEVVTIAGYRGEGSARLLTTGGVTGVCLPLTVQGCRWAGVLPADGYAILGKCPGVLSLLGNRLAGQNGNPLVQWYGPNDYRRKAIIHHGNVYVGTQPYTGSALYLPTINTLASDFGNLYWNPTTARYDGL